MLMAQLFDVHVRPRGQLYKGVADSNRMLSEAIAHLHGLPKHGPLHYCIEDHPIRIVALDSCPPGWHHGATSSASWPSRSA